MDNRDAIRAIDKRSEEKVLAYRQQHEFDIGTIKALTFSGACVSLSGSGRYLRNVQSLQGVDFTVGNRVMCARIGREKWVIMGAIERDNAITATLENTNIVPQPQNLSIVDRGGYAEIRWDASYFDIACWEIQVSIPDQGVSTFITDNTQFEFHQSQGLYYVRVRGVGPGWDYGSWTPAWAEISITDDDRIYGDFTIDGDLLVKGDVLGLSGMWIGQNADVSNPDDDDVHLDGSINRSTALGCRVKRSTTQSIPDDTHTEVIFDTEIEDTDGCFSASDTKLYARHEGHYLAGGMVAWTDVLSGNVRSIEVLKNGTDTLVKHRFYTSSDDDAISTGMFWMEVNDYIEIVVYHDVGAPANIENPGNANYINAWLARIP